MTSEEIKAQSERAIKYNRCCNAVGGGDIVTSTEKIYSLIEDHRKTLHALWMARAKICKLERLTTLHREWEWTEGALNALENAERKCLKKAKEFE